ncbi:MAG TPA: dTMP kinase [Longimicrobiales bacterium]|nr:dTMP kinase [Longimicrobiales bacterium]
MFLVLEGVEGSGKSTQARLLGDWLAEHGVPHVLTREPGGTAIGEEIRQILLHGHDMPAETELLLFNASRAVFITEVVRPALDAGKVVVADRFYHSSLAYQAYGRGLPLERAREVCEFAVAGVQPDLTIILDVPTAVGEGRRATRGQPDRIERAGMEFHDRVAEAYRLLPGMMPDVELISGEGAIDDVRARIMSLLSQRFPETFTEAGVR